MGMFDYVHFEMACPNCGKPLGDFQSKDDYCTMDKIEPDNLSEFYSSCHTCKLWIEFKRPEPETRPLRPKPLTREEVEAMGFVLSVTPYPVAESTAATPKDHP